ncbi:MAG TPA: T9SS type A sorting domain-containing protein [Cytophagaceae bacterium]|jgi:hypothetical protein|nr:T9SS type A sorting domain-containing protein [Cytophagaceae bacterium]
MKTYIQTFQKKSFLVLLLVLLSTPLAFAHWTSKGPFTGGSITCFTIADTFLFVGSSNGGVYWSKNKALTTWDKANYTGLTSGRINALTSIGLMSSASGMKVIAGTADAGVFVSRNKGTSWVASNSGLTNTNITALINMGQYIFAGTNGGGIFVSSDSAQTWTAVNIGVTNIITSFATDGTTLVAGTNGGGVFISANNGASWTAVNSGLANLVVNALTVSNSTIFAGTGSGIFIANIGSPSWSPVNTGLANTVVNGFTSNAGLVYAATNDGIYTSPDASVSWTATNTGLADTVTSVCTFNNKLYAGSKNDGIFRSSSLSPISWSMFNTGFNNLQAYTVYNSGLLVIVATNKGLYVSRDLAASYKASNTGLTDSLNVTCLTFAGSRLYVGTKNGGIFVSSDTGKTWATANVGLPIVNVKKIVATYTNLLVAGTNGAVYSTHLSAINWFTTANLPLSLDVTSLATDGSDVFLGTNGNGILVSTDDSTWVSFNTGLTNLNVTSIAIRGGNIFAGTNGGGVFRRSIFNSTWAAVNSGLPTLNILSLCASGQFIVAGYKGGVYESTSDGYEWKAPNVLLYIPSYADVHTISFTPSSTRVFVATPFNTIYSNAISELPATAVEPSSTVSSLVKGTDIGGFNISPNPNNGSFKLDLNGIRGEVREVTIFNSAGQIIRHFSTEKDQLLHMDFPKGVYFIHIVTDKGILSEKILIE